MKKLIAAALAALTVALFTACANAGQLAYIGDEAARAAALTGAGLSTEAVTFLGTELASRDGVEYYLVSFTSGDSRYESQVDALSGVVIQSESMPLTQSASAPAEASITAEDAKAKALAHAGLAETDVTFIKAELDRDDGRLVYDVEFYTSDYKEYDYEIDAATGAILSYDFDAENYIPQQNTGSYIGAEKAKSVALAHAGVSQSQVTRLRCELEKDDGRWEYQVEFCYGTMEYEYEIDAYTGAILSRDMESIYD